MTGFVLKIIATVAMVMSHLADANDRFIIPLFYIGKIALPIFAFLIVEGYLNTRSFKKYLTRILVFAVVAQYPFYKFRVTYNPEVVHWVFNPLFTFAVGLVALKLFDYVKSKFKNKNIGTVFGLIPGLVLAFLADFLNFDLGFLSISLMLIYYLLKNHKSILVWVYTVFMVGFIGKSLVIAGNKINLQTVPLRHALFQLLAYEIALGLITLYNNKRGKDGKYVRLAFYFFYPIQFALLILYMAIIK